MDQVFENTDPLLFGSSMAELDLFTLHPGQAQILKLWQIYLENVNPLLKVTHTPTLQARMIDAASDLANVSPVMHALMFSIYCISVTSLLDEECRALFGSSQSDLLKSYRFGCQQALLHSYFLRTSDPDCLTALFLYLVSVLACLPALVSPVNVTRYLSGALGIHDLFPQCLPFLLASLIASASTANQRMQNAVLSRLRCADGFGGRLLCSTISLAKSRTSRLPSLLQPGIARHRKT